MRIDVIVPTNNIEKINGFIESFDKLDFFREHCKLVIVGNGEVTEDSIEKKFNTNFIRINEDFTDQLIPFSILRGIGMVNSKAEYFLFLDDDNRFDNSCDCFFLECMMALEKEKCCTLQADKLRPGKTAYQLELQKSGFFWTGYGLFIKNVISDYSELLQFRGCCEETLFAYEALNHFGLPYIIYGNPTKRDTTLDPKWNEKNNPSYFEMTIQDNIQGYIQKKYKDINWRYYRNIPNGGFPNKLRKIIEERMEK